MLKGNNFRHQVEVGVALAPTTINNTTTNGSTITEPWKRARQIAFIFMGGAFPATTDTTITIQGQARSNGAWAALTDKDGNNLALTGSVYDDGGALESGALLGSFDLSRVDSSTYKAIRAIVTNGVATAAIYAIAYVLFDPYTKPTGQTDVLASLMEGAAS